MSARLFSENLEFQRAEVDSLNKLSYKFYYIVDSTIKIAEKALKKANRIDYPEGKAEALINLGLSYNVKGIFVKAEDYFRQALDLYSSFNDKKGIARAYQCLAVVYRNFNDYDRCFDFLNKSFEINKKFNYELGLSSNYNLLGNLFQSINKIDSAIYYYHKSKELRQVLKDSSGLANSLVSLGNIYFQTKRFDSAVYFFKKSNEIFNLIHNNYGKTNISILRGKIEFEKDNFSEAIKLFEESLINSKLYNFTRLILDSYEGLYKSYQQRKNFKEAFKYHILYSNLKDSVLNSDVNNKITNNLIKYETESKQKEIELLKKDNLLQESNLDRQRIILYSLIGFSILLFFLILGLILRYRYRTKVDRIIRNQNVEISKQLKISEEQNQTINEQNKKLTELNETKDIYLNAIQNELMSAARYVSSILPKKYEDSKIKIDWRFIPSIELGGDIFGYHWIDDLNFAFYLLDVSGHGVKSALHSVSVYNSLRFENLAGIDYRNPSEVLNALNHQYQMTDFNELYFTIWYGVYNITENILKYAAAGHPPAIVLLNGNNSQKLFASNFFIGGLPDFEFKYEDFKLNDHFKLYIYSDGAYEIQKKDGNLMTYDELETFLVNNQNQNETELDLLYNHLTLLTGSHLPDDFSILKISVKS